MMRSFADCIYPTCVTADDTTMVSGNRPPQSNCGMISRNGDSRLPAVCLFGHASLDSTRDIRDSNGIQIRCQRTCGDVRLNISANTTGEFSCC
jgi:hypothetical protein